MRVGVVGCGHVCGQHLRVLGRLPEVEIVGVADPDPAKTRAAVQAFGPFGAYESASAMIEATRPNVVHVLTPPRSHAEVALEAIRAGCHVLVEKPMAASATEAEEMIDGARRQSVHLSVCHNYHSLPAVVRAKRLVDQGAVGDIVSAEAFWRMSSTHRNEPSSWMRGLRGGVFGEVAPHPVYLLLDLLGDLRIAAAVASEGSLESAGDLRVLLESAGRPVALGISLTAQPVQKFIRIYGTRLTLHVDLAANLLVRLRAREDGLLARGVTNLTQSAQLAAGTAGNALLGAVNRLPRSHAAFVSDFYRALRSGQSPAVAPEEGLAVVRLLDQLWESLASAR